MKLSSQQKQEIETLRKKPSKTLRLTVPSLERILYKPLPVLDHGFVRVIDYMGDDSSIVQAARVSYGKGTKKISNDQGLINYLMRHHHTTPFEMCEIKFHIKLPIFVARQWIRHRTANVNEYSARYSILDREFYLPRPQDLGVQSKSNRQGRGGALSPEETARVLSIIKDDSQLTYAHYEEMLNEHPDGTKIDEARMGLARELARMNLTLNYYTQWYWKIDLLNFMRFLTLRADPHAQYEIRAYAEVMLEAFKKWLPLTYEAFSDYWLGGHSISKKGMGVIHQMLAGKKVTQEKSGMSPGEWRELMAVLGREEKKK